jgi:regulator of replication initiation timing
MQRKSVVGLLVVAVLGTTLIGCEDTKARQENEQLKARVAELVKETGDDGNRIDVLTQENAALKQENDQLKAHPKSKKKSKSKRHPHATAPAQ